MDTDEFKQIADVLSEASKSTLQVRTYALLLLARRSVAV